MARGQQLPHRPRALVAPLQAVALARRNKLKPIIKEDGVTTLLQMASLQPVRIGPIMATLQAKTVAVRAITTMPEGLHGAAGITAAAAVTAEVVGLEAPPLH